MSYKHTHNEKQAIISLHRNGRSVAHISLETGVPRSTIYRWLKEELRSQENLKDFTLKNFRALERKVEHLEGIIEILKTAGCLPSDSLDTKLEALENLHNENKYSVHILCEALDIPRGTFYNHVLRNKRENTSYAQRRKELCAVIQQIYDESNQVFGAKKIFAIMKEKGYHTSPEMVQELMGEMGLTSIRQGAKSTYNKEQRKLTDHVNQQFNVTRPDEVWVSDVTYFRFNEKKFYICVIIDLFARRVIAYKTGKSNSVQLVKSTFHMAYEGRKPKQPLVFHTDRGTNFRAKAFCGYLKSLGVTQSFSRAHVPYDNSVVESFFSNLKREGLYRRKYRSENEFRTAVDKYMAFYNNERPHATNQYKTPVQKEREFLSKLKK